MLTGDQINLVQCHLCHKVQTTSNEFCSRCGTRLDMRKPESTQRALALLITAIILYIPANIYPILETTTMGMKEQNSIIGGVITLWHHGSYVISMIVFVASVLIPVLKFLVLGYLLWVVKTRRGKHLAQTTSLFHLTEKMGPWSMIDVFVVTLLVALIQFGGVASVHPGAAALAFSIMVIVTMLSAIAFDTRLIWDSDKVTSDG